MSHTNIITIYFHIWTLFNPTIGIFKACRGISMKNINRREAAPTSSPNIAHSAWMHGTLWNAIFTSLICYEIDVIDTLRFNNDVDFLYRLATALGMRLNHEYWCKVHMANGQYQQNSHKWQLGFHWHQRGIEPVFKSLDYLTTRLFHSATTFCCYICISCLKRYQAEDFFLFFLPRFGGGALSSNVFTICAVYWSLGRRGYFGVWNVALGKSLNPNLAVSRLSEILR